ncbi:MAG: glutathione S-transferase family protein [Bdellovibrionia bacterium]
MAKAPTFELISFDICPYVQRSVITLLHKKVDFKLTFIDLGNPPEWFNKISPLGKVPVLIVHDTPKSEPVVLFESAVINEYLDEVTPIMIMLDDPLEKARLRAWIAVSGECLMWLFTAMTSQDAAEVTEARNDLWDTLARVEETLPGGDYFTGTRFSLVDAAFAPVFMRMFMMRSLRDDAHWKSLPKTHHWAKSLMELPEVKKSVEPNFKERYKEVLTSYESPVVGEIV